MRRLIGISVSILLVSVSSLVGQQLAPRQLRQVFTDSDFFQPVFLTHAGDGSNRLFVVERAGSIKVTADGARASSFLDIRDRVNDSPGEGGLLSVAFHPRYAENGRLYVYYTRGNLFSSVSEFTVSDDPDRADADSERVLWQVRQPAGNHNGGQLAFGPDGMLYIGLGDGGGANDQFRNGQNPTTWLGAILRIDVDGRSAGLEYGVPPDNPFVGNEDGWREEIWAYGLRNPWRFSFDRKTGVLWAADVGQGKWEEVDIIERGGNYGWNVMEGFNCFSPASGCAREGLALPVIEYSHSTGQSITGGYVYRAPRLSLLQGVYVYGDFVSRRIWGLRYEQGAVVASSEIARCPSNISSFGEDEAGEVYIVGFDGRIYVFDRPRVLPASDALFFSAALAPSWSFDFNSRITPTPATFDGRAGLALESTGSWRLSLLTDTPVDAFGFTTLSFAFHPGAFSLREGRAPLLRLVTVPGLSTVDLLPLVDLDTQAWQTVSVPVATLKLAGELKEIRFSGNLEGTFYVGDIRLVAPAPATPSAVVESRQSAVSAAFALDQNFPNPFNGGTIIRFALPQSQDVQLTVYNVAGQQVAALVSGPRQAGTYAVHWDGRDDRGHALASGVYLYRLQVGPQVQTRRLVLVQ
jgi:glucose/arabinose dehydrogenase